MLAETAETLFANSRDQKLYRVLELTYTAWDLEPFATAFGCAGPPFRWDTARRQMIQAELDAAFFHLYGLAREQADEVLNTFPTVARREMSER